MQPKFPESCDIAVLGPQILPVVPAVLDTIKNGFLLQMENTLGIAGRIVQAAVQQTTGHGSGPGGLANIICKLGMRRKVIEKVKIALGLENLRWIGCGGGAVSPETQQFVTRLLAPVATGFGTMETCGMSAIQEVFVRDGRAADRDVPRAPNSTLDPRQRTHAARGTRAADQAGEATGKVPDGKGSWFPPGMWPR